MIGPNWSFMSFELDSRIERERANRLIEELSNRDALLVALLNQLESWSIRRTARDSLGEYLTAKWRKLKREA